jgi:hypothetical protein
MKKWRVTLLLLTIYVPLPEIIVLCLAMGCILELRKYGVHTYV